MKQKHQVRPKTTWRTRRTTQIVIFQTRCICVGKMMFLYSIESFQVSHGGQQKPRRVGEFTSLESWHLWVSPKETSIFEGPGGKTHHKTRPKISFSNQKNKMCPIKGFQVHHIVLGMYRFLSHLTANHQDDTSSAFFEATRDPNVFWIWIHDCSGQLMTTQWISPHYTISPTWNKGISLPNFATFSKPRLWGPSRRKIWSEWMNQNVTFPEISAEHPPPIRFLSWTLLHQQFSWKKTPPRLSPSFNQKKNRAPPGPHSHTWPWPMLYWPWLNWLFIMKITQLSNYIGGEGTRKTRQCFPTIWTPSGITIDKYHHINITIVFSINPDTPKTVETLNILSVKTTKNIQSYLLRFFRCLIGVIS